MARRIVRGIRVFSKRHYAIDILAALLILLTSTFAVKSGRFHSANAVDYYQFWVIGQAIRTMEVSNIYSIPERNRIGKRFVRESVGQSPERIAAARSRDTIEPSGTPFLYALFDVVSTGDYDRDYQNFFGFSLFAYMTASYFLARLAGMSCATSAVFTVFATFSYWPLKADIRFGNVTQLQLGLVALFFSLIRGRGIEIRYLFAGLILAFTVLFKPNTIFAAALLVGTWILLLEREKIAWFSLGGLIATAVAAWLPRHLFGDACSWDGWKQNFSSMALKPYWVRDSLPSLVFRTTNTVLHRTLTMLMIMGIFWIVMKGSPAFRMAAKYKSGTAALWKRDAHIFSLGLGMSLLLDPLVHGQYFILVLPMAALVFGDVDLLEKPTEQEWIRVGFTIAGLFLISLNPTVPWHTGTRAAAHLMCYAGAAFIFGAGLDQFIEITRSAQSKKLPEPA
jgi:hypothetical protein